MQGARRMYCLAATGGAVLVGLLVVSPAGGATWNVSTVGQLNTAMSGYGSGDEIVLMAGYYDLYNYGHGYYFTTNDVTIRGATGNRDDVVLWAGGMNNSSSIAEVFNFPADDVRIKDLTISGAFNHAIHIQPSADRTLISNVHILNAGEHYIKGGTSTLNSIRDGIIEGCLLEQTEVRQNGFGSSHPDNYLGGIDLLGATNYQIRDNVCMHIQAINGGDAGIFMWQSVTNPTIERNVVIGCNKGIALGNPASTNGVSGAIVRNNFIVRDSGDAIRASADEIGLEICSNTNAQIYNNTIFSVNPSDGNAFRTVHLYAASTNTLSKYNIIRGSIFYNGGTWTQTGNITGTTPLPDWFMDPNNGNLHLTELASLAIGQALLLVQVPQDFDGDLRPYGNSPDIGADEWRLAGDLDLDLDVDFADYQTLEANFGRTGVGWAQGDMDFDGDVDFADYQALEANFGRSVNPASVPEPGMLLLLGAGVLALRRRQ